MLADKEFSLISELAKRPSQTQRELSQNTGLSLGMTNLLLKRLARKGYVKIRHLDWKRTQYLLTVEGIMEKTRKSYAYALHAIHQFREIRRRIHDLVREEYGRGLREAYVVAWPETAEMIAHSLKDLALEDLRITYVETFSQLGERPGVAFTATIEAPPRPRPGQRIVPLLDHSSLAFHFPPP